MAEFRIEWENGDSIVVLGDKAVAYMGDKTREASSAFWAGYIRAMAHVFILSTAAYLLLSFWE